jgi:hypothetical protein
LGVGSTTLVAGRSWGSADWAQAVMTMRVSAIRERLVSRLLVFWFFELFLLMAAEFALLLRHFALERSMFIFAD